MSPLGVALTLKLGNRTCLPPGFAKTNSRTFHVNCDQVHGQRQLLSALRRRVWGCMATESFGGGPGGTFQRDLHSP